MDFEGREEGSSQQCGCGFTSAWERQCVCALSWLLRDFSASFSQGHVQVWIKGQDLEALGQFAACSSGVWAPGMAATWPPAQLPLRVRREEPVWCRPVPAVLPGLSLLAPCPFPINYGVAVADAGPATEKERSRGIKVAYGWAGCR